MLPDSSIVCRIFGFVGVYAKRIFGFSTVNMHTSINPVKFMLRMFEFVKESSTLQNFPDSKVFGYKVPTLNSGFKISGDATKPERL